MTYYSLIQEKESILSMVNELQGSIKKLRRYLIFPGFPEWYEKLVARAKEDLNYLNPGAFYTYLMMLMYYSRD